MTTPHGAVAPVAASLSDPALATIRARLPPLSPCPECGATSAHICTDGRWLTPVPEGRDDARTLLAAHEALADALRAAEARAVAAEGAIAHLSHTLGCESGDPAGIVREALDYAAEQRERADDRDEALVERDAAEARLAALAGAVDAVRAAHATATEAGAQYRAAWDAVDATPTIPQSEAIAAALRVSYEAQETLDTALTTLLRGAPGGYVEARVVREYLAAADAFDAACEAPFAPRSAAEGDARAADAAVVAARTALDAALLAATTTPEEST